MKRRRRYGEKYSGLPYPEDFKIRMLRLFPGDESLEEALEGGWESIGRWFDELTSLGPALHVEKILSYLAESEKGTFELREYCEKAIERRAELESLEDEWQRIVFLDDQSCRPWDEIE